MPICQCANWLRTLFYLSTLFLCRFIKQVHKLHGSGLHLIDHSVYQHHQIVVSKHSNNTDNQTTYGSNHSLINTS